MNLALPTLAVWKARSFWAQLLLLATVLLNSAGIDLMGLFRAMGLGDSPEAVIDSGLSIWQMIAPLIFGFWAWWERQSPNFRLVWPWQGSAVVLLGLFLMAGTQADAAVLDGATAPQGVWGWVVVGIIGWIGSGVRSYFSIEKEARAREALHSASASGLLMALARGLSGSDALQAADNHVRASVPDALKTLSPSAGVVQSIIESKMREVELRRPTSITIESYGENLATGNALRRNKPSSGPHR